MKYKRKVEQRIDKRTIIPINKTTIQVQIKTIKLNSEENHNTIDVKV